MYVHNFYYYNLTLHHFVVTHSCSFVINATKTAARFVYHNQNNQRRKSIFHLDRHYMQHTHTYAYVKRALNKNKFYLCMYM